VARLRGRLWIGITQTVGQAKLPSRDHLEGEIRVGWRMAGLGMEVSFQVAAGALLGWGFDQWRGTSPKGILTGSVIGIVVAMWSLINGALKLNRMLDQQHPTKGRGRPLPTDEEEDDVDD
jgi:hypothetical protein